MNSYRTHTCSELRAANIGKPTTLIGWVDSVRDHGGVIFIDLRDRSGITQVVFHPEVNQDVAKASQQLRSEDMIDQTDHLMEFHSSRFFFHSRDDFSRGLLKFTFGFRSRNPNQLSYSFIV